MNAAYKELKAAFKITIVWDMMLWCLIDGNQQFAGTCNYLEYQSK